MYKYHESEIVQAHVHCPDCGSHDAMTVYTDHTFCFSCHKYHFKGGEDIQRMSKDKLSIIDTSLMSIQTLKKRGITAETCKLYNYYIYEDSQVANYLNPSGEVLFQKVRDRDKRFTVRGKSEHIFFGQHLWRGGKKLVITEGEIDCLTVSQVGGNKYPVVSIPFGTTSAPATFRQNLDWLNSFDEVVLMFDMDKAGREAVESVGGLLPPHKMKIATLPLKDANECLKAGHSDYITFAIINAEEYHPDGIKNARDLKESLFAPEADVQSFEFPWCPDLSRMTQGIRKGEMILLTAGSGIGKSTTAREIAYDLKMRHHQKIGMVMLEESPKKTMRDILSVHLSKPLHLSWNTEETKALAIEHFDEVFGDGGFILYDHFGSIESNNLLDKIRYLIVSEGCDFVIFDHISIAVTAMDEAGADERKTIDRVMTQLRSLVEETGAGVIVVSHLRKTDLRSVPFEQGGTISLDDLRGSGSLKQLPDTIIALERNQQADNDEDKNRLKMRILKCRWTGDTGLAGYIKFDKSKNRIVDVDPLEIQKKEEDRCEMF